jgi:hypothetical protein
LSLYSLMNPLRQSFHILEDYAIKTILDLLRIFGRSLIHKTSLYYVQFNWIILPLKVMMGNFFKNLFRLEYLCKLPALLIFWHILAQNLFKVIFSQNKLIFPTGCLQQLIRILNCQYFFKKSKLEITDFQIQKVCLK